MTDYPTIMTDYPTIMTDYPTIMTDYPTVMTDFLTTQAFTNMSQMSITMATESMYITAFHIMYNHYIMTYVIYSVQERK